MSHYVTLVIRMPEDEAEKQKVTEALDLLEPFKTGVSIEDEMTILELIENHDEFDAAIADEARAKTLELHAQAESVSLPKSKV